MSVVFLLVYTKEESVCTAREKARGERKGERERERQPSLETQSVFYSCFSKSLFVSFSLLSLLFLPFLQVRSSKKPSTLMTRHGKKKQNIQESFPILSFSLPLSFILSSPSLSLSVSFSSSSLLFLPSPICDHLPHFFFFFLTRQQALDALMTKLDKVFQSHFFF